MTDIISEQKRDAIRQRLLEALDAEFGAETVKDQHLPKIFRNLDEIMDVAAEAKLELEWAESFIPRVYFSMDPVVICRDKRGTNGYGHIYWNRTYDDQSRKAVTGYQYRTGYPTRHWVQYWTNPYSFAILGPFKSADKAGDVATKLNNGWSAATISDYALFRIETDDPVYLGFREVVDVSHRSDTTRNGMTVREVHFNSYSKVMPDNAMVLYRKMETVEEAA